MENQTEEKMENEMETVPYIYIYIWGLCRGF